MAKINELVMLKDSLIAEMGALDAKIRDLEKLITVMEANPGIEAFFEPGVVVEKPRRKEKKTKKNLTDVLREQTEPDSIPEF